MKKPLSSVATQPEPEAQNEKSVGSSWTAIAEDGKKKKKLFTVKVNQVSSKCLNLIERFPRSSSIGYTE